MNQDLVSASSVVKTRVQDGRQNDQPTAERSADVK